MSAKIGEIYKNDPDELWDHYYQITIKNEDITDYYIEYEIVGVKTGKATIGEKGVITYTKYHINDWIRRNHLTLVRALPILEEDLFTL
jgi:hypothetical protein